MKFLSRFLLIPSLLSTDVFAQAREIRFCVNESASFNFYNKAGTEKSETPGILIDFVHDLEKKLGLPIQIVRRTRRACRTLLQNHEVDAYGPLSYELSRDKNWAYPPLKDGVPDPQYAFITAGYTIFYNVGSSFTWTGERISDLAKYKIGSLEGNSVVENLRQEGVTVQTFKSIAGMLIRLQNREIDAIAVHESQVGRLSGKMGFAKHEKPLYTRGYFLVLSDKFHSSNKELSEKFWKLSSEFIKSPEGQKALRKYEQLDGF